MRLRGRVFAFSPPRIETGSRASPQTTFEGERADGRSVASPSLARTDSLSLSLTDRGERTSGNDKYAITPSDVTSLSQVDEQILASTRNNPSNGFVKLLSMQL